MILNTNHGRIVSRCITHNVLQKIICKHRYCYQCDLRNLTKWMYCKNITMKYIKLFENNNIKWQKVGVFLPDRASFKVKYSFRSWSMCTYQVPHTSVQLEHYRAWTKVLEIQVWSQPGKSTDLLSYATSGLWFLLWVKHSYLAMIYGMQ